jgi:hypothetical protein
VGGGACNPSNCPGCCVGDICAIGTQDTACGVGGGVCSNCANQAPARVCETGTCQLPTCGKDNCPNGCCIGNTCVAGNQDNACGLAGGGSCQDCTATKQTCAGGTCQTACGPSNCSGCCQADGTCAPGIGNGACGGNGAACADCRNTGSFCNGLVVPRVCNDQQTTCPAPYGGCLGGTSEPIIPQQQGVCTDSQLDALASACAGGPEAPDCVKTLLASATSCSQCLKPFAVPFTLRIGLWACAAPSVNGGCRRALGCGTECTQTSCNQCADASEDQCFTLVTTQGNACAPFATTAAQCTRDALDPGQLCSQFSYSDFGQWFRAVGDHYCGNGP